MKNFKITISRNDILLGLLTLVMYACAATCYYQTGNGHSIVSDKNISIKADSTSIHLDILNDKKPLI